MNSRNGNRRTRKNAR
uniref:Uncharacterized protein n=1 Tax=Arundo donax TaxID=35708 RepID=A0A0A8YS55_ARUDO